MKKKDQHLSHAQNREDQLPDAWQKLSVRGHKAIIYNYFHSGRRATRQSVCLPARYFIKLFAPIGLSRRTWHFEKVVEIKELFTKLTTGGSLDRKISLLPFPVGSVNNQTFARRDLKVLKMNRTASHSELRQGCIKKITCALFSSTEPCRKVFVVACIKRGSSFCTIVFIRNKKYIFKVYSYTLFRIL